MTKKHECTNCTLQTFKVKPMCVEMNIIQVHVHITIYSENGRQS